MTPTSSHSRSLRAASVALLVVSALTAACSPDPPRASGGPDSKATPAEPSGSTGRLLYVAGKRLRLRGTSSDRVRSLGRLPSADVVASPGQPWLAYVSGAGSQAADFIAHPELHLVNPAGGTRVELGAGFAPLWHPTDDRLAYLRPIEDRGCDAEVCRGASEVMVADAGSRNSRVVLDGGPWVLLAWAGDHLVVGDRRDVDSSIIVGPSGESSRLPVPPAQVWDGSPDGAWLLIAGPGFATFLPLEDGTVAGEGIDVELPGATLGEGAWAPDSSRVAAAVRSGRRARLVLVSPRAPDPVSMAGTSGVVGEVLWAADSGALATSQVTASGHRLRALFCRVRGQIGCRGVFSWVQDVVLLALR